jgi:hypothetical protein
VKIPKTEAISVSANGCPPTDVPDSTKPMDVTSHFTPYSSTFPPGNTSFPPVFPANIAVPPPPPVNTLNHIVPPMHMNVPGPIRPLPSSTASTQPSFHPPYSYPTNSNYFTSGTSAPSSNPQRTYYPPQS